MKKRFSILCILFFASCYSANGQLFYHVYGNELYVFDGSSCARCFLQTLNGIPQGFNGDVFVLPNGDLLITSGGNLLIYSLPDPDPILNQTGLFITGTAAGPGGLVYMIAVVGQSSVLYTYDPATGAFTSIGPIITGLGSTLTDLYYFNGELYASGSGWVLQVNVADPPSSTVQPSAINSDYAIADEGFYIGQNFGQPIFAQFNPTNNQKTIICNLNIPVGSGFLQQIPPNVPQPPLCCATDAGTLSGGPFNICGSGPVNFSAPTGTILDGNDLLQYILFTNPADTLGSIIATSNTPTFAFNPATMQTGVTYYLAAIVGNNSGGNVNLNDACLDISNALQVAWRQVPAVSLSVSGPDVCASACIAVSATFTGTPPFTLTYTAPGLGPVSQTFSGSAGSFQVCVPVNAPLGGFSIAATLLADAFCTCN